jgi:predicted 2-oxoglutarate/Fe(II)-dependent dioxygenase YbiX
MLEFPFHKVEVEATPGSVVLFPSGLTYDHQAHPVTGGIKYSLVTFFS